MWCSDEPRAMLGQRDLDDVVGGEQRPGDPDDPHEDVPHAGGSSSPGSTMDQAIRKSEGQHEQRDAGALLPTLLPGEGHAD